MSVICPNGHTSDSTDYCDTCGEPIAAAPSAGTPAPGTLAPGATTPQEPPAAEPTRECPNCGAAAPGGALFCENCGYDFTTGTAPTPLAPPVPAPDPVSAPAPDPAPAATGSSTPVAATSSLDISSTPLAPPVPGPKSWVAEVWIDPDWYAQEQPEDPMPSVGAPRLVPLRGSSLLVGRPSRSQGIKPDLDGGTDNGISRRHCQLSTDGVRWWVEDLQSSNGTYVSSVGDPLPSTPITPGEKVELEEGSRLYLGGWTRIVVREALPGES